ncbi:GL20765 [Drosophila persimilis]|uniref:GL20765 n=1 Tax=Drosophila persimilis TaxID=7234 RepID=B4H3Z4_DROPE|nr:GL20765 [Drosophila persimilis]
MGCCGATGQGTHGRCRYVQCPAGDGARISLHLHQQTRRPRAGALNQKAHKPGPFLIAENEILSSAQALARYMRERKFNRKVYIVGGQGIKDELRQVGIESLPLDLASTQENSMVDQVQKMYLDANVGAVAVDMDLPLTLHSLL